MSTLQEHKQRYYKTMPHIYDLIKYARSFIPVGEDRWGTIYVAKDVFRILVKLEIYEHSRNTGISF